MDRVDHGDDVSAVDISHDRLKQWIGYGFLMLAIYLERHAAFDQYCRTHNRT